MTHFIGINSEAQVALNDRLHITVGMVRGYVLCISYSIPQVRALGKSSPDAVNGKPFTKCASITANGGGELRPTFNQRK